MAAIIMIIALLASIGYSAIRPWLLDSNPASTNNFNATLTGISALTTNCDNAPRVNLSGTISPAARQLCVCGQLFTNSDVDYRLALRSSDGQLLHDTVFNDQEAGRFCQPIRLNSALSSGRYFFEITPRRRHIQIHILWFSVQSSSSA